MPSGDVGSNVAGGLAALRLITDCQAGSAVGTNQWQGDDPADFATLKDILLVCPLGRPREATPLQQASTAAVAILDHLAGWGSLGDVRSRLAITGPRRRSAWPPGARTDGLGKLG